MPPRLCSLEIQTPLATSFHLLITLLVAVSYIPQLIQIINDSSTAGISGWYIILLTISAITHFATRLKSLYSITPWACFRHGELKGFDLFSSLVVHIQAFTHWLAALILLSVYVWFHNHPETNQRNDTGSTPSTTTILAIVLTHLAIILPPAIYLLHLLTLTEDDDTNIIAINILYGAALRTTGTLTSLTAAIPQIHLMVSRYQQFGDTFDQGSLSLLGLGLQVLAFTALGISQGWRMRERQLPAPPGPRPDHEIWIPQITVWSWDWWYGFFVLRGLAAGWFMLAGCQLVVLAVALGLGGQDGGVKV
ncbi:hypothetical protein BJY04DRAFT_217018 [Aspergillus karnatakaensis]|uniref:PQ-loop repeat-containing protein n=1 Tax=Aspergillus karnatakaensis TaxID=1810916 RepID=UPI003CCCBFA9